MDGRRETAFCPAALLSSLAKGRTTRKRAANQRLCTQGDPALSLFYIQRGQVKLTVVSKRGKEATVGLLGPGDFFGEGCLAGQNIRTSSASCISDCTIVEMEKRAMMKALREMPALAEGFLTYVLTRNIRYQEDLVDQLFNKSEKRLARLLVLLARLGQEGKAQPVLPKISQETLAQMIGTTRGRVSYFMTKFKKMGLLDYDGGIHVHSSLLRFLLTD